jgi:hypothetical protein
MLEHAFSHAKEQGLLSLRPLVFERLNEELVGAGTAADNMDKATIDRIRVLVAGMDPLCRWLVRRGSLAVPHLKMTCRLPSSQADYAHFHSSCGG